MVDRTVAPAGAAVDGRRVRERLAGARLYLCTDGRRGRGDFEEFVEAALRGGVDIVQLREKGLEARAELALLEVMADAAGRHGALWSVNDRADLAAVAGADVLHLGQDDLPVTWARKVVGDDVVVGRSSHSVDETQSKHAQSTVDETLCKNVGTQIELDPVEGTGKKLDRYASEAQPAWAREHRGREWPDTVDEL